MKHLLFITLLYISADLSAETPVLAVDSSLTAPLREIVRQYELETGQAFQLTFGVSDRIARQIVQGFSYELFISASAEYIDLLFSRGVISTSGWEFANSQMIIFVPEHSGLYPDANLRTVTEALRFLNYRKIAIPDPDHLPYGTAALQVLQSAGIWALEHNRTLMAEDVMQLAGLAVSDVVDLSIIPSAFMQLGNLNDKGIYLPIPANWYHPVSYFVIMPAYASAVTREFERFLAGDRVRLILEQHGYATPELQ